MLEQRLSRLLSVVLVACTLATLADAQVSSPRATRARSLAARRLPARPIHAGSFHLTPDTGGQQALGAGAPIGTSYCEGSSVPPIFGAGFESGGFDAGGFEVTSASVTWQAAYNGQWGARLHTMGGSVTKAVSTVGYTDLTLRYVRRASFTLANEKLRVEWSIGGEWHLLEVTPTSSWQAVAFPLPFAAANHPLFRFRFRSTGTTPQASADIDDVRLTGRNAAHIEAFGSTSVADNDLTLVATGLPVGTYGLFFYGPAAVHLPLGDGFRCVGGQPVRRIRPPTQADGAGQVVRNVDLSVEPALTGITLAAPVTMNFQYWFRQGTGSGLSDALSVDFVD